jgi:UDP-N-acetylglucosamine transferase subunit ALG13
MFSSTKSPPTSPAIPAIDGGFTDFTGGTTSLVVPSDVTSITALVIGASGGGGGTSTTATIGAAGGGGGALSYSTIAVTPNETLTIEVGDGGARGTPSSINGSAGGDSYIARGGTNLILAKGGAGGLGSTSGSTANTGGGAGGDAASGIGDVKNSGGKGGDRYTSTLGGGGGGVSGYSGTGGAGGTSASAATAGAGGGGGGGAPFSTTSTGVGGGTLFYGAGSDGAAGTASTGQQDGKLGSSLGGSTEFGSGFAFAVQGGGDGGTKNTGVGNDGGTGGDGIIRILWGNNRSFPSTNVGTNTISLFASVTSSTSTITVPAGVRPGDYIILLDYADDSAAVPASTRPSGFGSIFTATNATTFTRVNYSDRIIVSESYAGTVLTGMTGNTAIQKFLLVFRGTAGYCEFVDDNNNSQLETTSAPTTQTVTDSSLDAYVDGIPITFAFFKGSSGITSTSQLTFSGATFIQGTSNIYYCGYKIYNQATTSVNDSISMQDRGTNTMCSFLVRGF